jgi:CheY-like chemotaxis protein
VVEDNPADVFLIRAALQAASPGCDVIVAMDGERAFATLEEEAYRPDVIVLDLNVPRRDGRAVLKFVRETPRLDRTAVVVLTSSPAHLAADVLAVADGFLVKPSDYDEFIALGAKVMDGWRKRQAPA